jgi:hypothetical protein
MAQPFSVCLHIGGKHFTATGASVMECIEGLKPDTFKTQGKFIISHDGKQSMRIMHAFNVRKLFVNKIFKQVFEKNALATLK